LDAVGTAAQESAPGSSITHDFAADAVVRVRALADERATSAYAVIASAFALALARFTGTDEVGFAAVCDDDDAIGIRVAVASDEPFTTLIDAVGGALAARALPVRGFDGVPEAAIRVRASAGGLAFAVVADERTLPASLAAAFTAAVAHVAATAAEAAHVGDAALQPEALAVFPAPRRDPDRSYAEAQAVPARFRAQARTRPQARAVVDAGGSMRYGELATAADRIRRVLLARGVRPGDVVGIVAERSALAIAAMLATWEAGAAFVAFEPDLPEARRRENADDAGVGVLLDDEALRAAVAAAADATVLPPARTPQPEDAAYILYTSGSTGRAKGVVVEHGNLARLFTSSERAFAYGSDDVWSMCFPFAFDAAIWNVWAALAYGGALVVLASDLARDPFAMRRAFAENRVTVVAMTPSAFAAFDAVADAPYRDAPLRAVMLGGEATTPAFVARFHERYERSGTALWNLYGPTEATVFATAAKLTGDERFARFVTIGTPLDDIACAVVDPRGRPVPAGFVGELVVRGAGVARGYRGAVASRAFARRGPRIADRTYATGDLARMRADGSFEYLRRDDAQINMRGFRIELGEIEAALLAQPDIADAAATFAPSDDGGTLTAHIVPTTPGATLDDVASRLAARLPAAMLPTRLRVISAMPLTATGKRDLRALAAAANLPHANATAPALAETPFERYLCAIAAEVLGLDGIGAAVDFFSLGGHSLLAVRFAGRAARNAPADGSLPISADDMSVVLRALYERRTMRALAQFLARRENTSSPIVCIRAGAPEATPLFWFHGMYGIARESSYFGDFLAALPPEMPVYAVEPHGYDGAAFASDFTILAQDRFEHIRRIRPRGAVRLGGFSNGAMAALETARLFRRAGEHVDSLTLVSPAGLMRLARLRMRAYELYARVRKLDDDVSWGLAIGKVHRRAGVVRFAIEHALRGDAGPALALARKAQRLLFKRGPAAERRAVLDEDEGAFAALEPRLDVAIARYVPRPYNGNVTVIVGNADDPWRWTRHRWKRMIPHLVEHVVPGDHHFVVEHAHVVAAIVAAP
jgi:amino acid adenylation domain-containing protein